MSFKSLFNLLKRKTDDFSTSLSLSTFPIMDTPLANLAIGDQITPLPPVLLCPRIAQPMPLRTPVTILLLVISKVAFAKGTLLLVQRLPLRGNHHFDPFHIDLLKLFRVCITCVRTGDLAGLLQNLMGLIDLLGKLIDVF